MKISYSRVIYILIIFTALSCSTYSIKTHIKDSSALKIIKKTGVIFRIPHSSKITREESIKNFLSWLSIYQKNKNILIITDASDSLAYFNNPQQRFYQLSNENKYLKYKSIGVLNQYLQYNQNELLNIISKNNLDSITIFEVYSIISTQMQFFEFESVLAVADSNLNLVYLDHQSDYFESESSILSELKNQMLDIINNRLVNHLRNVNLLGGKDEKQQAKSLPKDSSTPEDKTKVNLPIIHKNKPAEKPAEKSLDAAKENKPSGVNKKEIVPATLSEETKRNETQPAKKAVIKDIPESTPAEIKDPVMDNSKAEKKSADE